MKSSKVEERFGKGETLKLREYFKNWLMGDKYWEMIFGFSRLEGVLVWLIFWSGGDI